MKDEEKKANRKIMIGPPSFRLMPSGIYPAMLFRIDDAKGAYENEVYAPWFEIKQGPYRGCEIKDMINKRNAHARNSKLCHMIRALEPGFRLEEFNEINLDELIGKDCHIKVERRGKNNAISEYYPSSDFKDIE